LTGIHNGAVVGATSVPNGRMEFNRIGDLTVLPHIQRVPKDSRIKALAKAGWQPKKQGILLVAHIQDGDHAGVKHVYDGGTRWKLAKATVGDDYIMPCWVEDLTEAEAAEKFDIFNSESKKPTAYDHYKVGVAYGEPYQTAIKVALDQLGLEAGETSSYGNGDPGVVAALAACKRIIDGAYKAARDITDDHERWATASSRLVEVLEIMRDAYTDETAHDADMMQAVARLRAQHGELSAEARRHLVNTIQTATVARWRSAAQSVQEASGSQGGSVSRSNFIAQLLATDHNGSAPTRAAKLNTALTRV
jgi:hypothetical protein